MLQRASFAARRAGASVGAVACRASTAAVAAPRGAVRAVKRGTGIVGLDVEPDARNVLIKLYEKTLEDIKVRRRRDPSVDPARRRG